MKSLFIFLLSVHFSVSNYYYRTGSDSSSDESGMLLTYRQPYYAYRQRPQNYHPLNYLIWLRYWQHLLNRMKTTTAATRPVTIATSTTKTTIPRGDSIIQATSTAKNIPITQQRGDNNIKDDTQFEGKTEVPTDWWDEGNFVDGHVVTQTEERNEVPESWEHPTLDGQAVTQSQIPTAEFTKKGGGNGAVKVDPTTTMPVDQCLDFTLTPGRALVRPTAKRTLEVTDDNYAEVKFSRSKYIPNNFFDESRKRYLHKFSIVLPKDESTSKDIFILRHKREAVKPFRSDSNRRDILSRNGDLIQLLKTTESLEISNIKVDQDYKEAGNPREEDDAGDYREQNFNDNNEYQVDEYIDSCENYHCPRGKVCNVNTEIKLRCVCQDPTTCPSSIGKSDMVCGTDNKTYENSCHLFAAKCTFKDVSPGQSLHLDYTGACKYIAPCLDNELSQFSLLIRNWLKDVLVHQYEYDLKKPGLLTKKQRIIVKKIYNLQAQIKASVYGPGRQSNNFEMNYLMNIYPVHWQFGQLDRKPADGYLSHSELAPLRASIIPMDHCKSRFFKQCDSSRDKRVSLKEWCSCFGIKNNGIDLF
ncbi:uncharacterized protein LOC117409137 isoform X2 [Acipenser ruthenus]|uniref:uncharacterized protein LOC117409137 isoform X2 n=1 Tax=Acipenser ruthenus TaxID=7906 RepID=UPI00274127B1|nr:uncharacterized protein LOC117409137 isoform X2 [Acipenser ruthenus]